MGAQRHTATDAGTGTGTGPLAAFALLAFIWGYNWVVMKLALRDSGPLDFAVLRVVIGAVAMLTLLAVLRIPFRPRYIGRTALLGVFQTTGFVGLMTASLVVGEAGKSAVLAYTMPFWVILFGWPFLGERLLRAQWAAVGLAFVGLALVLEPWNAGTGFASSALALGAGAAWAVSVLIVKRIPITGHHDLISVTTWQMVFGALPLAAAAGFVDERPIEWSGYFVGALLYNGIGGTALAMLLWLYILQRLPATISGLSSLLVPIVGVIAAWIQLSERPSSSELAGMIVILFALAAVLRAGRVRSPAPEGL